MTYIPHVRPANTDLVRRNLLIAMIANTQNVQPRMVSVEHDGLTTCVTGCSPLGLYNAERICKALTLLDKADAWLQANYNPFEPDNQSERYMQFKAFYEQAVK
jgi:hypothetical protein